MLSVLQAESFKINKSLFLKNIIFLVTLLSLILNLIILVLIMSQSNIDSSIKADILSSFELSINFYIPIYGICLLFCCLYLGQDFEDTTIKNILSVGCPKEKYYISKILVSIIYVFGLFFTFLILTAIFHHIFFGFIPSINLDDLYLRICQILLMMPQLIALICIVIMIAFVSKSASLTILFSFGYFILETILNSSLAYTENNTIKEIYKLTLCGTRQAILNMKNISDYTTGEYLIIILIPVIISLTTTIIGMIHFSGNDVA